MPPPRPREPREPSLPPKNGDRRRTRRRLPTPRPHIRKRFRTRGVPPSSRGTPRVATSTCGTAGGRPSASSSSPRNGADPPRGRHRGGGARPRRRWPSKDSHQTKR